MEDIDWENFNVDDYMKENEICSYIADDELEMLVSAALEEIGGIENIDPNLLEESDCESEIEDNCGDELESKDFGERRSCLKKPLPDELKEEDLNVFKKSVLEFRGLVDIFLHENNQSSLDFLKNTFRESSPVGDIVSFINRLLLVGKDSQLDAYSFWVSEGSAAITRVANLKTGTEEIDFVRESKELIIKLASFCLDAYVELKETQRNVANLYLSATAENFNVGLLIIEAIIDIMSDTLEDLKWAISTKTENTEYVDEFWIISRLFSIVFPRFTAQFERKEDTKGAKKTKKSKKFRTTRVSNLTLREAIDLEEKDIPEWKEKTKQCMFGLMKFPDIRSEVLMIHRALNEFLNLAKK